MKKPISLLLTFLLLSQSILSASPKIATLDVSKALAHYEQYKKDLAKQQEAREQLENDPRKIAVNEMANKFYSLKTKFDSTKEGSTQRAEIQKEGNATKAAFDDLSNQWTQYHKAQKEKIKLAFIESITQRNAEIYKVANDIGKSSNFDWILETSGQTNSRIPIVLYIREFTDITDKVIEALNQK